MDTLQLIYLVKYEIDSLYGILPSKVKTETRLCDEHFPALWDSFCGLVCWCLQPHFAKKASQVALAVRKPPAMQEMQEMWVQSLGWEDPLKKEMATCSNILAWKIPWTEEPGGPPMGKPPLLPSPHQAKSRLPAKCPSDPGFCTHAHLSFLVQGPSLLLDYESPAYPHHPKASHEAWHIVGPQQMWISVWMNEWFTWKVDAPGRSLELQVCASTWHPGSADSLFRFLRNGSNPSHPTRRQRAHKSGLMVVVTLWTSNARADLSFCTIQLPRPVMHPDQISIWLDILKTPTERQVCHCMASLSSKGVEATSM